MYSTEAYLNPQQILKDQDWLKRLLAQVVEHSKEALSLEDEEAVADWSVDRIKLQLCLFQLNNLVEENAHELLREEVIKEQAGASLSGTWTSVFDKLRKADDETKQKLLPQHFYLLSAIAGGLQVTG